MGKAQALGKPDGVHRLWSVVNIAGGTNPSETYQWCPMYRRGKWESRRQHDLGRCCRVSWLACHECFFWSLRPAPTSDKLTRSASFSCLDCIPFFFFLFFFFSCGFQRNLPPRVYRVPPAVAAPAALAADNPHPHPPQEFYSKPLSSNAPTLLP